MKVLYREKIFAPCLDPFLFLQKLAFRAVTVPAGVIRYLQMAAVVALIHMAAEFCRPAGLDRAHSPQLITGHGMDLYVLRAVLPEDIGDFDPAAVPRWLRGLHYVPDVSLTGRSSGLVILEIALLLTCR